MALSTGRASGTTRDLTAGAESARGRGGREPGPFRRAASRHWYAWAMVAPVVLVTALLIGWPLARGVYLSLTDATEANIGRTIGVNVIPSTYEFVGLENYVGILTSGLFWEKLTWTVVWTVACVALHYGLGLGLALMLNRRVAFRSAYRLLLILPWAIPGFVSAFIWRYLYNSDFGVINAMLRAAGLGPVGWLDDPTLAKVAVIAVNVWMGVPFMMVAVLGGLQSIPGELYEAAEVDGATPWQRFRFITLPGLRTVSSTVVLLGTIWTFNMFPVIYLITGGGPGSSTEILVTYAFREAFTSVRNYSNSAAWGVIILLLLVVLAVVYRRSLRKQGEVW
ncbi:arabinogalactan oligomer/maltooligosaccharide transport system permease protein [Streptosporangium becharense]|uniref:Arabinogalactan oligomer/maltooligosaccharide transport system permease protein n=1 Tax=Streptosporangium becharense TaxID=1816182 RepID=A0A7W9ILF9_9ACTN|nr:sugar ABC transporter permease [Streptosporangium becharense]MBB2910160.1 arabinogalactan oligomer/maltooligosaccharide transport system permease protein [Streptosporangium becharense]MBB5822903.1 arabinogalactan oligomer/maltooligosaccharide transport system permease protein [Streptosporangium becharense]